MLTKPTTVKAAVAPLLKVLNNLEGVCSVAQSRINANEIEIARLRTSIQADTAEDEKAAKILAALSAILDPEE